MFASTRDEPGINSVCGVGHENHQSAFQHVCSQHSRDTVPMSLTGPGVSPLHAAKLLRCASAHDSGPSRAGGVRAYSFTLRVKEARLAN
jgi:hypothetical protein